MRRARPLSNPLQPAEQLRRTTWAIYTSRAQTGHDRADPRMATCFVTLLLPAMLVVLGLAEGYCRQLQQLGPDTPVREVEGDPLF